MGAMKDLYLAREEWAEKIGMQLDENVTIIETPRPDWWRIRLDDGILITRIDDSLFVENCIHDWTEIDTHDEDWASQLDADIEYHRNQKEQHLHLHHLNK